MHSKQTYRIRAVQLETLKAEQMARCRLRVRMHRVLGRSLDTQDPPSLSSTSDIIPVASRLIPGMGQARGKSPFYSNSRQDRELQTRGQVTIAPPII